MSPWILALALAFGGVGVLVGFVGGVLFVEWRFFR